MILSIHLYYKIQIECFNMSPIKLTILYHLDLQGFYKFGQLPISFLCKFYLHLQSLDSIILYQSALNILLKMLFDQYQFSCKNCCNNY